MTPLIDRAGMRDDLLEMAERADKFRRERLFIVTDCHDFYYFAQGCRAFATELAERMEEEQMFQWIKRIFCKHQYSLRYDKSIQRIVARCRCGKIKPDSKRFKPQEGVEF